MDKERKDRTLVTRLRLSMNVVGVLSRIHLCRGVVKITVDRMDFSFFNSLSSSNYLEAVVKPVT